MIILFLLMFALVLSVILLDIAMKIALIISTLLLIGFVITYVILKRKKFFGRFTDGWQKYAVLALKIFLIAEMVFNSLGIIISGCYLLLMPMTY